jgi:hypothetical protein
VAAALLVASDELSKGLGELDVAVDTLLPRSEGRKLPVLAKPSHRSRVQSFYSKVAIEVEGVAVEVRCWSEADWPKVVGEANDFTDGQTNPADELGFVLSRDRANLSPDVCKLLDDLVYRRLRPGGALQLDLAQAVVVLVHEANHVAGTVDEAETECYAVQLARKAAVKLGTSRVYADRLARRYWRELYPRRPPAYRTPECRNGGPLDLYPDSPLWP